jgi:hypothetical protein
LLRDSPVPTLDVAIKAIHQLRIAGEATFNISCPRHDTTFICGILVICPQNTGR